MVLLTNCNGSPESSVAQSPASTPTLSPSPKPTVAPTTEPSPTASPSKPDASKNALISTQGIGAARLGMTLGELKQILGPEADFTVKSPFIVDFDAIAVRQAGEVQYYILYLAGQSFTNNDVIQGLFTDNSKFHTPEGVGPGTSLKRAEQAYGKATLSYNTQNESREYARFDRQPAANLSFSTGNGNAAPAGIYPSPTKEYNETKEFRDDATVQSVLVVCLTEGCAPPASSN
jgi:hypothetical protein